MQNQETNKFKKLFPWLLALGFALLFFGTVLLNNKAIAPQILPFNSPLPQTTPKNQETVQVTRVIDGDTIEIEGGIKIRYIGIDTPETNDCFGNKATEANKALVLNKNVKLEYDVQKTDKYGRTLSYVYVDGTFVNEQLVKDGFAKVSTYPPNVKYQDKFIVAQKVAKEKSTGLWAPEACDVNSGWEKFDQSGVQGTTSNCLIKGNINSSGEKIYHVPGQRYYEKTQVDENVGEHWFCTENEAEQAGWRKSKV